MRERPKQSTKLKSTKENVETIHMLLLPLMPAAFYSRLFLQPSRTGRLGRGGATERVGCITKSAPRTRPEFRDPPSDANSRGAGYFRRWYVL